MSKILYPGGSMHKNPNFEKFICILIYEMQLYGWPIGMDLLPMILNMGAFLTTLILCRLYKFASLFEFLKYLSHFIRIVIIYCQCMWHKNKDHMT